jgi:hypothetical protein
MVLAFSFALSPGAVPVPFNNSRRFFEIGPDRTGFSGKIESERILRTAHRRDHLHQEGETMKRPFSLGDLVRFKTTGGQFTEGIVIHRIVEKRQPTIFLIECSDRRRAFRFETEISLIAGVEIDETSPLGIPRFEAVLATPVFACPGVDD